MWFRFGLFSVFSICYRFGSVYVRFWFLWFLVDFGFVRFDRYLEYFILFFFLALDYFLFIVFRKRFYEEWLLKNGKN